jgi:DNA-binding NarL/FixJ family response regulator
MIVMSVVAFKPPYRIYVVEDSTIVQRLLLEMLGGIPGAFIVGHSGRAEEAIAEIVEKRPDAIIVDLMLQSGSGFDVLEAIPRQSAVSPVVVVLTNFTMPEYRDRAAGLGAAHFFDKSTGILEMVRVMARLVEGHQRRSNSNTNHA